MNACAVSIDLARYERRQEQEAAKESAIEDLVYNAVADPEQLAELLRDGEFSMEAYRAIAKSIALMAQADQRRSSAWRADNGISREFNKQKASELDTAAMIAFQSLLSDVLWDSKLMEWGEQELERQADKYDDFDADDTDNYYAYG